MSSENITQQHWIFSIPYESGYSWLWIIIGTSLLSFIILVILFGNSLVIIAIILDKSLKAYQNWFILSLAVADLLVGAVVMPFSIVKEVLGYWIFGGIFCPVWLATDVLLCTASILNLCMISFDRFFAITKPTVYTKNKRRRSIKIMIVIVWILSICISTPLLFAKAKLASTKPHNATGLHDQTHQPNNDTEHCELTKDIGYIIYSTMGSFYIPLALMICMYARIYFALRQRTRDKLARLTTKRKTGPRRVKSEYQSRKLSSMANESEYKKKTAATDTSTNTVYDVAKAFKSREIPTISLDDIAEERCEHFDEAEVASLANGLLLSHHESTCQIYRCHTMPSSMERERFLRRPLVAAKAKERVQSQSTSSMISDGAGSLAVSASDVDDDDDDEPDDDDDGLRRGVFEMLKNVRLLASTVILSRRASSQINEEGFAQKLARRKRRAARERERRTQRILLIIVVAFIVCWLPFFTLYLTSNLFNFEIREKIFATFFLLGYVNSALNPIFYAAFNQDFRRAFRKLLLCKHKHFHQRSRTGA